MPFEGTVHDFLSLGWFLFKTYLIVLVIFWIRGTYPRLRIDQLMAFGWKILVPFSFLNIILTSFVLFYEWPLWVLSVLSLGSLSGIIYLITILPKSDRPEMSVSLYNANELRATVANESEIDHT